MTSSKGYSLLSHTADAGLIVSGATKEELFVNAARGTFAFLSDEAAAHGAPFAARVSVEGIDAESLLVNWLSELLYLAAAQRVLPSAFTITSFSETSLTAEVSGRTLAADERVPREIKAVTYHELRLVFARGAWRTHIIFDI